MKAVLLMNHGGPEMLRYGAAPDPTAGPGEVVVDIHAAIEVELIDRPAEKSLGAGEGAQGPAVAAIMNAFANATGKRIRELPMTPDRVKAALG